MLLHRLACGLGALLVLLSLLHDGALAQGATGTAAPAIHPPVDLIDRLPLLRSTLKDATALLGSPRANVGESVEFLAGGYLITLMISTGEGSGLPKGTILKLGVEHGPPPRRRDLSPIKLLGYWTPQICDLGKCDQAPGSTAPLSTARLKDLGLVRRCTPNLLSQSAIRYVCRGRKENGFVDVEVDATLSSGATPELADRFGRAAQMIKIRDLENDLGNPRRGETKGMRELYVIMGPITNEAIWSLVQDMPVGGYSVSSRHETAR